MVAAAYIGIDRKSLSHASGDTLCLNEYRRRQGKNIIFLTAQVIEHARRVALSGRRGGKCKAVAERVLKEMRGQP